MSDVCSWHPFFLPTISPGWNNIAKRIGTVVFGACIWCMLVLDTTYLTLHSGVVDHIWWELPISKICYPQVRC
jgi:hypothetical protein